MAALMSALVGIDWPVNSVGVIPDVDRSRPGYLKFAGGAKDQAEASLVNAKVRHALYAAERRYLHVFLGYT